jgi:hypothetical protein
MQSARNILKIADKGLLVLSALLCLASVAMWVRSYFRLDQLVYAADVPHRLTICVGSTNGTFYACVYTDRRQFDELGMPGWEYSSYSDPFSLAEEDTLLGRLGFGYVRSHDPKLAMPFYSQANVPSWFLAAVSAVAPALWLIRRRRRILAGHCQACGYDLRETPQRCPECGAATQVTE